MSYTNETTHYGIPKPLGTDLTTPMDYNQAADAIDTAVWGAVQDSATAVSDAASAVSTAEGAASDVSALGIRVTTLEGTVTTQGTAITGLSSDIADVRADVTDNICAVKEATAAATYAHAVGTYFYYNDILYKTTTAIAIGDTIVPNTNCAAVTIATEIYKKYDINTAFDVDSTKQLADVLIDTSLIPDGFTLQGYYLPVMIMKTGDASVHFAYIRRDNGKLCCGESNLPTGNYLLNATCNLE